MALVLKQSLSKNGEYFFTNLQNTEASFRKWNCQSLTNGSAKGSQIINIDYYRDYYRRRQ